MGTLRILGSYFTLSVGILIFITTIVKYAGDPQISTLIVGLIFGTPALLGGILGFASKPTAGGVLAVIIAGFYILIITISLIAESNGFESAPLSFFLYQWNFAIIISQIKLVIPIEAILISLGGIFLLIDRKAETKETERVFV